MNILQPILGTVVLLFGRRLYWAFVAILGFLVGMQFGEIAFADQPASVTFLVALAIGALGALLAVFAQRFTFALGGFYVGGYLALNLAKAGAITSNSLLWFAIGAVIGAILALVLMDWAIIVLSSLAGAGAIVDALVLSPAVSLFVFAILAILGIVIQGRQFQVRRTQQQSLTY
jgi:hypothetical protein